MENTKMNKEYTTIEQKMNILLSGTCLSVILATIVDSIVLIENYKYLWLLGFLSIGLSLAVTEVVYKFKFLQKIGEKKLDLIGLAVCFLLKIVY